MTNSEEFYEAALKECKAHNLMIPRIIPPTDDELKEFSNQSFYHHEPEECAICHKTFDYGKPKKSNSIHICGLCKIEFQCPNCKKKIQIPTNSFRYDTIIDLVEKIEGQEIPKFVHFCKKGCATAFKNKLPYMRESSGKIFKEYCKTEEYKQFMLKHNGSDKMRKTSSKNGLLYGRKNCEKYRNSQECLDSLIQMNKKRMASGYCAICGKWNNKRDVARRGYDCGCAQKWMLEHNKKLNTFNIIEYCEKCKMDTPHNAYHICSVCGPMNNSSFINMHNVRYYRDKKEDGSIELILLKTLVEDILSGIRNIEDYPEFDIRCDRVYYCNRDVLNDDIISLQNKFVEVENELWFNSGNGFKPWDQWKNEFISQLSRTNLDEIKCEVENTLSEIFGVNKYEVIIQPTYRKQEWKDGWKNGSNQAFERGLIESGVGWFSYIKMITDNGSKKLAPIVAGKSGSQLVNRGSDVSFSLKIKDGPSRKLIKESESIDWYREEIIIIKCETEKEALDVERKLQIKLGLLGS